MSTNSQPAAPTNSLRLYPTNAFKLASKFGDFRHSLALLAPDIAIITEAKLTDDKMSQAETAIPGYSSPPPPPHCGGTEWHRVVEWLFGFALNLQQ